MTYGSTGKLTLTQNAELTGGGTITANEFDINGKISPDKFVMTADEADILGDGRIGTSTLQGANSSTSTVTFRSTVIHASEQHCFR